MCLLCLGGLGFGARRLRLVTGGVILVGWGVLTWGAGGGGGWGTGQDLGVQQQSESRVMKTWGQGQHCCLL